MFGSNLFHKLFRHESRTLRKPQAMRPRARLQVQALEDRTLMAAGLAVTFDYADHVLRVAGTAAADEIRIVNDAGKISVEGHEIAVTSWAGNMKVATVPVGDIQYAFVEGEGGDDHIEMVEKNVTADLALSLVAIGGQGKDTLISGSAADGLHGGTGMDTLEGNGGNDRLEPRYAVSDQAAQLDRDLGLFSYGDLEENWGGKQERWVMGNADQYYFILPDGSLYRWDGTDNAASGQKMGTLDPSYYQDIVKLVNAQHLVGTPSGGPHAALAVKLDRDLGLTGDGSENWGGKQEKWLYSDKDQSYYYILPTGALHRWDKTPKVASGPLVATLDPSYYADISKLADAQSLFADPVDDENPELAEGPIYAKWVELGREKGPLGDRTSGIKVSQDGVGRFQYFEGGTIFWTPDTGAHGVYAPLKDAYDRVNRNLGPLGYPTSGQIVTPYGAIVQQFQGGDIWWSQGNDAHAIYGEFRAKFNSLGERGILGYPTSDIYPTVDGVGRFMNFERGAIFETPGVGVFEVHDQIHKKWAERGFELGDLGYPISNEIVAQDGRGRFNLFQKGVIFKKTETDTAYAVFGAIGDKYQALGMEKHEIGYPTTDELPTLDGVGRFNEFERGSIYWHPSTGAFEVHGLIRDKWTELGRETGILGYPISDEIIKPDGWRYSDFQYGTIMWREGEGTHLFFNRNNMIRLFEQAAEDGIATRDELNFLNGIVGDPHVYMPEHVRNLAFKALSNEERANHWYMGAEQPPLEADAANSGAQLRKRVNEWFRGSDNPFAKKDGGGNAVFDYGQASGTLFGSDGQPRLTDVNQGWVSNCYYMAALGAMAQHKPQVIRDMFIDNGDGTYTVRFFHDGHAEYVTVDTWFPANQKGQFVFANGGQALNSSSNVLWVALAEKAYAKLNESGIIDQDGSNSYQGIAYGQGDIAMEDIIGHWSDRDDIDERSVIAEAFYNGKTITFSTNNDAEDVSYPVLAPAHVYTFVGFDENMNYIVYNPWGQDNQGGSPFTILTQDELERNFDSWSWCD